MKVRGFAAIAVALIGVGAVTVPAQAAGGKPVIRSGVFVDTFDDDYIFELCGIETTTTETQRWQVKTFPDGSQQVHVVRTYVTADPRIPMEKGAATAVYDAAGNRTVVGTPIHLMGPRGTVVLDAGRATLDVEENLLDVRGPHPIAQAGDDLAQFYCP